MDNLSKKIDLVVIRKKKYRIYKKFQIINFNYKNVPFVIPKINKILNKFQILITNFLCVKVYNAKIEFIAFNVVKRWHKILSLIIVNNNVVKTLINQF